jgi:hypothetical protein
MLSGCERSANASGWTTIFNVKETIVEDQIHRVGTKPSSGIKTAHRENGKALPLKAFARTQPKGQVWLRNKNRTTGAKGRPMRPAMTWRLPEPKTVVVKVAS